MSSVIIHSILARAFAEFVDKGPFPTALTYTVQDIENNLDDWIIYYQQNQPVACVHLKQEGINFGLSFLAVLPEYRRQKIGSRLISMAEQRAIKRQAHIGWVQLRSSLHENINFFKKNGYQFAGPADEEMKYVLYFKKMGDME